MVAMLARNEGNGSLPHRPADILLESSTSSTPNVDLPIKERHGHKPLCKLQRMRPQSIDALCPGERPEHIRSCVSHV